MACWLGIAHLLGQEALGLVDEGGGQRDGGQIVVAPSTGRRDTESPQVKRRARVQ